VTADLTTYDAILKQHYGNALMDWMFGPGWRRRAERKARIRAWSKTGVNRPRSRVWRQALH